MLLCRLCLFSRVYFFSHILCIGVSRAPFFFSCVFFACLFLRLSPIHLLLRMDDLELLTLSSLSPECQGCSYAPSLLVHEHWHGTQGSTCQADTSSWAVSFLSVGGLLLFVESLSNQRRQFCPKGRTSSKLPLNSSGSSKGHPA